MNLESSFAKWWTLSVGFKYIVVQLIIINWAYQIEALEMGMIGWVSHLNAHHFVDDVFMYYYLWINGASGLILVLSEFDVEFCSGLSFPMGREPLLGSIERKQLSVINGSQANDKMCKCMQLSL